LPPKRAATVAAGFARQPAVVVGRIRTVLKRKEINKEGPRKGERK
jgi:hypothetical protein